MLTPWNKSYNKPRQHIKKQRHHFVNKGSYSQSYDFSSSHIEMWELNCKESWVLNNWWFWTVLLEKTLESPLDSKEIQSVHPQGNQLWMFIGRTDTEAEAPMHWLPAGKSQLVGKNPWCWERLSIGREGDDKGCDGCMVSPTQWTWVWANSRRWWRTEKPGVLHFIGWQRVRHVLGTEQQQ